MSKEYYQVKNIASQIPLAYEYGRFVRPLPYEKKAHPFGSMKVCDYYVVPCESLKRIDLMQKRVSTYATQYTKRHNKNVIFITRRVANGIACIRVS
jgi:hypothetical protein